MCHLYSLTNFLWRFDMILLIFFVAHMKIIVFYGLSVSLYYVTWQKFVSLSLGVLGHDS